MSKEKETKKETKKGSINEQLKYSKILKKLVKVQKELKAPKGQYNAFGKYHYRSAEDILEGVKPLLDKANLVLLIRDELELIGDRYYIKAVVTLLDSESGEALHSTAYAREAETQRGMDSMQLTGATSSYARKYALNGMFAIDDSKDADTNEYQEKNKAAPKKAPVKKKATVSTATPEQVKKIKEQYTNEELAKIINKKPEEVEAFIPKFTVKQASELLLKKKKESEEKDGKK